MIDKFPVELQNTIKDAFAGEIRLSYAEAEQYNSYVVDADYATSISASGRMFIGADSVREASVNVAKNNSGERNRTLEWISAEYEENMAYIVFRASVETQNAQTGEFTALAWVVSMIFRKVDGKWKIAHRQNTRWNK